MNTKQISTTLILLISYYFTALLASIFIPIMSNHLADFQLTLFSSVFGLIEMVLAVILLVRFVKMKLPSFKLFGWALLLSTVLFPIIEQVVEALPIGTATLNLYLSVGTTVIVAVMYAIALMLLRKVGSITPRYNLAIYLLLIGFMMPLVGMMLYFMEADVDISGLVKTIEQLCCVLGYYFLFRNPDEFITACESPQKQ